MVQDEFGRLGRVDRGVKEQSLAVLAYTGMPAVLTELGFISNAAEEQFMNSDAGKNDLARALLNAVKQYKKIIER